MRWFQPWRIIIDMLYGPLYDLISWTWDTVPGFNRLDEQVKACITVLLFNGALAVLVTSVYWWRGLL